MFESAELGHEVDKATYDREVPHLRAALLDAQADLKERAAFPLIVLANGVDGAGKGETVNLLNAWMDPRNIQTNALRDPEEEERARPPLWRFWTNLPRNGEIGIFVGSWYSRPLLARVMGGASEGDFASHIDRIVRFERLLTDDGAIMVKLWFHLSRAEQKKRLRELEKDKATRWRVSDTDWKHHAKYGRFLSASEEMIRKTSVGDAPWTIVEGSDARYRALTVGNTLLAAMRRRLDEKPVAKKTLISPPTVKVADDKTVLSKSAHVRPIPKKKYDRTLEELQGDLNIMSRSAKFRKRSCVLVFEGMDAAGKGGAIRRVASALDARSYRVIPIAAPREEERAHPYLWRFWSHIPKRGEFAIFDRSWYGRVLVERVEKFCAPEAWMRAYSEINDFEEQLTHAGSIVIKFWLKIDRDEQLRRFRAREKTGFKRYKITPEDWRNRKRWREYEKATSEMIDRTSTELAPWTIVSADDKEVARIRVLETITKSLRRHL